MTEPESCRLAQNLARNCGWHVFPCQPDNKRPWPRSRGFYDASIDPAVIARMWRPHPESLIAIRCGSASGVAVLDVDIRGPEACAWWKESWRRLLPTRVFRTRSGGLHLYYQHTAGIGTIAGKPTVGVDVRGEGGYAIYWYAQGAECLDHSRIARWPAWLSHLFWPPRPAPAPGQIRFDGDNQRAVEGILRTLQEAREGTRNGALFWCSNRLRERGLSRSEIEGLLAPIALGIGLERSEVAATIGSASRAA